MSSDDDFYSDNLSLNKNDFPENKYFAPEDFEALKGQLPREGESVVIIRNKGRLNVARIAALIKEQGEKLENNEKVYGNLLLLNKKLKDSSLSGFIFVVIIAAVLWMVLFYLKMTGWFPIIVGLVVAFIIYGFFDTWYNQIQKRKIFLSEGAEIMNRTQNMLRITENELLTKIMKSEELREIQECYVKYCNIG